MSSPNTFIIGAPKCGTTAMAKYLGQHPNVFFSQPKEPHYFLAEEMLGKSRFADAERYFALFDTAGDEHLVVAEASVWYLFSHSAVQRIRQHDPAAKIIVMLRRPDEMVYSMHNQSVISLNEDITDFHEAWTLARSGTRTQFPEHCREPRLLKYDEIALYAEQLKRVYEHFPKDQVKVILFEDFKKDTAAVFKQSCEFLGLDASFEPSFEIVNENQELRSLTLGKLMKYPPAPLTKAIRKIKRALGLQAVGLRSIARRMNSHKTRRESLPESLRQEIIQVYEADIRQLETLLDRDLTSWLS